jgi:hypothetical protein
VTAPLDVPALLAVLDARIAELSRPDGRHIYDCGIHAEISRCGECGRLWEMTALRAAVAAGKAVAA